jgi:hypothetical protein
MDNFFIKNSIKGIKQGECTDDNKSESRIETKGGRLSIYLRIEKMTSTRTWNKKFQGGNEYEN